MIRNLVALCAVACLSSAATAATPYDMRGAELGTTLEAFKSLAIPTDSDHVVNRDPEVRCTQVDNGTECEWIAASSSSNYKRQTFTRIGDGGGYATFLFSPAPDGQVRLRRIDVRSNMDYLDGMLAPMMVKFGKPAIRTEKVQNAFGAGFEKATYTWSNGLSRIELEERCGKIHFLCLTYVHEKLEAAEEARMRREKGDPVTKL